MELFTGSGPLRAEGIRKHSPLPLLWAGNRQRDPMMVTRFGHLRERKTRAPPPGGLACLPQAAPIFFLFP